MKMVSIYPAVIFIRIRHLLPLLFGFLLLTPQAHAGPAFITVGLGYAQPGWKYTLETSADLIHWAAAPEGTPFMGDGLPHAVTCATQSANRMFFRWRVTDPSPYATAPPSFGALGSPTFPTALMDVGDPALDSDQDGFSDVIERLMHTDPHDASSNPDTTGVAQIWWETTVLNAVDSFSASLGSQGWSSSHGWDIGPDKYNPIAATVTAEKPPMAPLHPLPTASQLLTQTFTASYADPGPLAYAHWYQDDAPVNHTESSSWSGTWNRLRLRTNLPRTRGVTRRFFSNVIATDLTTQADTVESVSLITMEIAAGETGSAPYAVPLTLTPNTAKSAYQSVIAIEQPILNTDGNQISTGEPEEGLRLCRWLSSRNSDDQVDRTTFPAGDKDRIQITLGLAGQTASTLRFHLKTTGAPADHPEYNDTGASMDFTDHGGGQYYSEPFVLVADQDDDALPVGPNLVADGATGDRTFIAYPGGKLVIEGAALSQPIEVPIEKSLNELTPIFIILDPTTDGSAASLAIAQIIPNQLARMQQIYATLRLKIMPGNWLVLDRAKIQELDTSGHILSLLSNEYLSLGPDFEEVAAWVKAHWQEVFTSGGVTMHTSTGAVLPLSKVVPIMMLPNRMENSQGAVVGYCSILSELCAVSVPALTDKPDNTAVTMAHELGHFFSIPSDHDGGSGPLFPGYRLMAGGLKRRPITRDKNNISSFDQNPDATGKHFIFSDGICVRMLRGNYVTPIPSH